MKSIKSRLTLVSMVVLVVFMVLTAIALERAVVKRALQAEEDGLQLLIYSLLAAVDQDSLGRSITVSEDRLFEPSLVIRNSGLYALLYNRYKREIWRSESITVSFPAIGGIDPGEWDFQTVEHLATPYFRLGFSLQWPDAKNKLQRYEVVVWRNAVGYFEQLNRFRQTLWAWLIITTLLLLLVMYLVTRWSLIPLQKIGLEVKAIEDQKQSGFEQEYPDEIAPLTENLNILLKREQYQRQRYRNAMDDLAHSLKTPLAVLTGLSDQEAIEQAQIETLREQTERMNQIVSYQLQKTTGTSDIRISKPIDLIVIIDKLLSALEKVYQEKGIVVDRRLPAQALLRMDEGDCLEVVGNLLDNAFKYGHKRISIDVRAGDDRSMTLTIEDDGDGLAADAIQQILNRGTRLDEATEGQGIGLAVVGDIVESYNIELKFSSADLGGLRICLVFQKI
ncbi:MAG: ATP-binding protein [Gammaproteobacteria bacterium]|nr:ATP-binding protein [Gammaproteobacteria bacterium]MDH3859422.1 ATP-binding protein [Gammaproteobacteria bacterium]